MIKMANESNINQYLVHENNMEALKDKLTKLNRKAEKLNFPLIVLNVLEVTTKVNAKTKEVDIYHKIEINGDAPKLNGWKFIAKVETIKDDKHNILFVAPNETVPTKYRESGRKCDHCLSNRYRKYTYILHHDNGEYTQVGSSCLKDFLGHANPHNYAKYLEWMEELNVLAEGGEEVERGSYSIRDYKFDLEHFVSYIAEYVKQTGYFITGKKAEEMECTPTSMLVWNEIHNTRLKQEEKVVQTISEESLALAKDAIRWGIELGLRENLSDYFHNLYISCLANVVDWKSKGIVASLITAYKREMGMIEKKVQERQEQKASVHVGEVGQRYSFELLVTKKSTFETQFGWTTLHIMKDENGNVFTWFSSNKEFDEGTLIIVKGTVKEHREYNDVKQTVLTRCTILKNKKVC
jgi:hypothetical protein